METHFEREVVMNSNGYPMIWDPDHPLAMSGGYVYVHRHRAWVVFGEDVLDKHVHHIDGDPMNWSDENLELLTASEHVKKHRGERERRLCYTCGGDFKVMKADQQFCSPVCYAKSREVAGWPPVEILDALVRAHGYSQTGRLFGVSDNAVRKRIQSHS